MKTGFKETLERIEMLEELAIAVQEHGRRLIRIIESTFQLFHFREHYEH